MLSSGRGRGFAIALAVAAIGCGSDDSDPAASGGASGSGATAGAGGSVASGGAGGSAGAGAVGGSGPPASFLPKPTGTCPDFVEGAITIAPAGIPPRQVQIWISDAASTLDGPLVFWWHGTGGQPKSATTGIGSEEIAAIKAKGGIVAAPFHDPAAGTFPWFLTTGSG